jgi:hypothetical protein
MSLRLVRPVVLLAVLAMPMLACKIITQTGYTIGCTSGSVNNGWVVQGEYDNTGSNTEHVVVTVRDGAGTVLLEENWTLNMGNTTLSGNTENYDVLPKYNPITVTVITPAGGSLAEPKTDFVATGTCPGLPTFDDGNSVAFNDGRINNTTADQPVSIYCKDDGSITVFAIYDGKGYLAFTATKQELAKYPEHPAQNTLIKEAKGARLYKLTSGEYQVNRTKADNSEYEYRWNGCGTVAQ